MTEVHRIPTPDEMRAMGLERHVVDRSSHPSFYASSWPVAGSGLNTLGMNLRYRIPHLNFNSVLVTVISNHWHEGGWWRLQNMLRFTEKVGYTVALEEVDDMSTMPADAIGIMRACAAMLALDGGFEWCFMVDTDVHLEEDTLVKLMVHDRPVVYPMVVPYQGADKYPGGAYSSPRLMQGKGLQPVTWAVMSAMLFNTKVFNCLDAYSWHGHDYHFAQCLNHFGHRIYVDTDTVVQVTRGPARHPVTPWPELWANLERAYESRRNDDRHREPPPDFEPVFGEGIVAEDGTYWAEPTWKQLPVNGPMQESNNGAAHQENPEELGSP